MAVVQMKVVVEAGSLVLAKARIDHPEEVAVGGGDCLC